MTIHCASQDTCMAVGLPLRLRVRLGAVAVQLSVAPLLCKAPLRLFRQLAIGEDDDLVAVTIAVGHASLLPLPLPLLLLPLPPSLLHQRPAPDDELISGLTRGQQVTVEALQCRNAHQTQHGEHRHNAQQQQPRERRRQRRLTEQPQRPTHTSAGR